MKVYVLVSRTDMSNFCDMYGECAPDNEDIIGIFANERKAKEAKHEREVENKRLVDELSCDPNRYEIYEYEVQSDMEENMNRDNNNVLTVVDKALKLYGASGISVDKTEDGMIDVNIVERHCYAQPYFSSVAQYNHCDLENLKKELDSRYVDYIL